MYQASVVSRCACLIFNPIAGQSNPEQDLKKIQSILEPELDLDVLTTTPEVDTYQLAKDAVDQKRFEAIIVSGGDGTVSAVASAVVETDIPLGIIPRGTANAFANALGIPTSIEDACATILAGTTRVVDAASCNGRPMILLAGIGFEAETVNRADREYKDQFGMLAYILAGLEELSELETFAAQLETNDKNITLQAAAVTVANIAPPTSVLAQGPDELISDDGLLDVTIMAPTNSLEALAATYNLLQSALLGKSATQPNTGYLRTKRIKITTDPPQKVVKDGELIGHTPVEIECIPRGLTIFVPTESKNQPILTEKLANLIDLQIEPKEPGVVHPTSKD
ncbi:MAG: YegS/Rv2252/BmrU family lipid kinase [Chroococcidiopsidaceae cyanobacterium CP_BM_ER_R8_30]|nr:YegS/Rv2252/BmrU family lipid kinase [Chroococcidiopsidaceae cyanobacterium CP_BM_ER_R8_30]